jgi:hypothetical protein
MNFLSVTVIALVIASTNGFSVTMSSIGYLDNLAKGSVQLSSFATTSAPPAPAPAAAWSGSSYAPPAAAPSSYSYGSTAAPPAPAPAQYKSSLADAPANNDLHYLKTLGGGSSVKSGRNYSGVSSYFRTITSATSYTDNLKGKTMAPASYTFSAPPPPQQQAAWGMPPSPPPAAATPPPTPPPSKAAVRGFGSYLDNL